MPESEQFIQQQVQDWLERVVIGLQLCPFAQKPVRAGQLRVVVSTAADIEAALYELDNEINFLDQHSSKLFVTGEQVLSAEQLVSSEQVLSSEPVDFIETTLLVLPKLFSDFYAFNDFLAIANDLLESHAWEGVYQIASFHPHYQFAGTEASDAENLTNVAPYPIVHILREQSVTDAVESYAAVEEIPERNIQRMNDLTEQQRAELFPFLSD